MKKLFSAVLILLSLIACEKDIDVNQIKAEDISSNIFLDNPIIYESTNVIFSIKNSSTEVESVMVYLNDEIILNQNNETNINFEFDPELYATGEANIKIEVVQNGADIISKVFPITIHRKLLDIKLDDYFFQPGNEDYFLFASANDGSILATKAIESTPATFTLTTEINIGKDTPYMLTLASRYLNNIQENTNLYSVDGLTRSTFKEFTPKSPRRRDIEKQWRLNTAGFSADLVILGSNNPLYSSGYDGLDFSFFLTEYRLLNDVIATEKFYVRAYDLITNENKHMWLNENDLNDDYVLNMDDLTSQDQVEGTMDITYSDGFDNGHARNLHIKGYESQEDFSSNNYHSMWLSSNNVTQSPNMFIRPTEVFTLNTSFFKYSHMLHLEDYLTIRVGAPLEQYGIPDWSLDFDIQDKEIAIAASGIGHYVGKVLISSGNSVDELPTVDGKMLLYYWNLNFNSTNTSSVKLPELPQELKNWSFGKFYESSTPKIKWVRLERYEGITDYGNYLELIIKENNVPLNVSPLFEAKFKSNDEFDYFINDPDTFFH